MNYAKSNAFWYMKCYFHFTLKQSIKISLLKYSNIILRFYTSHKLYYFQQVATEIEMLHITMKVMHKSRKVICFSQSKTLLKVWNYRLSWHVLVKSHVIIAQTDEYMNKFTQKQIIKCNTLVSVHHYITY